MDKDELRRSIINKRKELAYEYRINASDSIVNKLFSLTEYENADTILVYADSGGEVATDKLILNSLLKGKRVFAPVCGNDYSMDFYEIFALDELYPGHYGIREPLPIESLKLTNTAINEKTLIIVPGVVFDKSNNRMGYGRGYYDRYLAKMPISIKIALAYDFQLVDAIQISNTDVPMDIILTN